MKSYLEKYLFILGESKKQLPGIIFLFIVVSGLDLIGLGMIGPFLSLIASPDRPLPALFVSLLGDEAGISNQSVLIIGFSIVMIFVIKSVISALISRKVIFFSQFQQIRLRKWLLSKYQQLPYEDFIRKDSNHYINAIQNYTQNFAALTNILMQNLGDAIVSLAIVVLLIWTNPIAFIMIAVLIGGSIFVYDLITRRFLRDNGSRANQSSRLIFRHTRESLDGFREIKIIGCEDYFHQRLARTAETYTATQVVMLFFALLPRYIIETAIIVFIVGLTIIAVEFEGQREALIPTLGIFGVASLRILPLARNLSTVLNKLHFFTDTINQLADDLRMVPATKELTDMRHKGEVLSNDTQFDIALQNVSFSYSEKTSPVLKKASMTIASGESIGIVGSSGAGKSTLVNVLLGFLKPQSGQLIFNGHDVTDHPEILWDVVAYLPQELFFIDGTFRENITLGQHADAVNTDRLNDAVKLAQLEDVISKMPEGLDTMIGESGFRLSGGQRQRIALARAFYYDKKIIILDEATSALDLKTENQVIRHINSFHGKITVLYISHRKSTLRYCDRVFSIKNGSLSQER